MMIETGNMDFGFSCEGIVEMAGKTVELDIELGRVHEDPTAPSKTTIFMGYLSISDQTFEIDFTSGEADKILSFNYLLHECLLPILTKKLILSYYLAIL
jgi:hypothetical protein